MEELFEKFIYPTVAAFFAAAIGWVFGAKKQRADTEATLLDNTEKAIEMYKKIIDDQAQKYDTLLKKHNELLAETEKTIAELRLLRNSLQAKEIEISKLKDIPIPSVSTTIKAPRKSKKTTP